ncbi:MAG: aspartyl-tRNA synthetase 2, mitochondrial [Geoglossum simile]|nr:MAG: aspartyl-tRNA synthetase 2, mitochondrial [Geoglossum simile]
MSIRIGTCGGKFQRVKLGSWAACIGLTQHLGPSFNYCGLVSKIQTQPRSNNTNSTLIESKFQDHDIFESIRSSLNLPSSTHEVKDLSRADIGQAVAIYGYLGERTDLSKNFLFAPVISKELDHRIQIVSSAKQTSGAENPAHQRLKSIGAGSPVVVCGILKGRTPAKGDFAAAGSVEIILEEIHCLNQFPKDIIVTADTRFPPEERHLQLRTDRKLLDALRFRAKVASICRDELATNHGFLEVETPLLFKSTPEGAREFLVPTRRKGLMYALPQSPQQYKQILMAGGVPRYYQIARCFRDEDLRADRQPEFTQLDLEMSFARADDVMKCVEVLIKRLWETLLQVEPLPQEFRRMSYQKAMSMYGSDKPDIRLGMEIFDVSYLLPVDLVSKVTSDLDSICEVLKIHISDDPTETRKFVNRFMDSAESATFQKNPEGAPGVFVVDSREPLQGLQSFGFEAAENIEDILGLEDGDLVVLQARKRSPHTGGSTLLGKLRLALHNQAITEGYLKRPEGFEFLWVVDFPLFSPTNSSDPGQGGAAGISSTHHPFTSPKAAADIDLLLTDPLAVRGDHYDLVVNGIELGGGSRRIHDSRLQEFVLRDVLQMSPSRLKEFSHLLEILRAGCPPHAGIALGFDRLIAVMLGRDSVRDVIAFPKSGKGEDLLVKSPSFVSKEALETYHLQLRD